MLGLKFKKILNIGREKKAELYIDNLGSCEFLDVSLNDLRQFKKSIETEKAINNLSNNELSNAVTNSYPVYKD